MKKILTLLLFFTLSSLFAQEVIVVQSTPIYSTQQVVVVEETLPTGYVYVNVVDAFGRIFRKPIIRDDYNWRSFAPPVNYRTPSFRNSGHNGGGSPNRGGHSSPTGGHRR